MLEIKNYQVIEVSHQNKQILAQIAHFRLEVWRTSCQVNEASFSPLGWTDSLDSNSRHWIATDSKGILAAARLTVLSSFADYPDSYIWKKNRRDLPGPVAYLSRLVVHPRGQRRGIGSQLNQIRIETARVMGAKSIFGLASKANSPLLERMGFIDTGIREEFSHLVGRRFKGLEYVLNSESRASSVFSGGS